VCFKSDDRLRLNYILLNSCNLDYAIAITRSKSSSIVIELRVILNYGHVDDIIELIVLLNLTYDHCFMLSIMSQYCLALTLFKNKGYQHKNIIIPIAIAKWNRMGYLPLFVFY